MSEEGSLKRKFPWEDFHGPNLGYVMEQYDQYKIDPNSIDIELKEIFDTWGSPSIETNQMTVSADHDYISADKMIKIAEAVNLVTNIRRHGHLNASIYPFEDCSEKNEFLQLEEYDLTEEDLKDIPAHLLCKDAPEHVTNGLEAYQYLKDVYKRTIAFEFSHVHNYEEKTWLLKMVESGAIFKDLTNEKRRSILKRLTEVEGFEQFLHRTFVGQKRFSIEGLDMLVPILDELISSAVQSGTDTINIGMAHRGRLNVLAHVLGKPYEIIFSEFQHAPNKELVPSEGSIGINYGWSGDVKYHLGANKQIKDENTVRAKVTLANNPSHLEFIDPIVEGYTRAAQEKRTEKGYPKQDESAAMAILIHGDAAFPGEGIVSETLNLNKLTGYQTGGTIHIIANNMIGFTTESRDSRSTKYASDIAKGYEIPIVHVNADDPEACLAAVYIAMEFRNKFKSDFLIDLIGYRRFGHNEMDEPSMTQPKLYEKVRKHPTVRALYGEKLVNEGVLKSEDLQNINEEVQSTLEKAHQKVPDNRVAQVHEIKLPEFVNSGLPKLKTSVDKERLLQLNEELVKWPENFKVFPKLKKILEKRGKALSEHGKVDWSLGETLAFASILEDGTPIRLTGQDSQRGTFAHRHIVLHDIENGENYSPLHKLSNAKASFAVHNSPLSEGSVLGFEYGYNVFAPETLVLWEAQFGDFANAAQVFFDQFIAAGRAKWGQKSGLVMLLPHGFEGQGPEHSSARLERYLQLAAEDSWQVANLTSAAQYFHILRRQADLLKREEVRPLVIMTPKSLLRNLHSVSDITELSKGEFKPVIEQSGLGNAPEKVKRLVLCSGKVSIDLLDKLNTLEGDTDWVHILRVEELYPFPKQIITSIIDRLTSLEEIVWVQEEPQNMGAWLYIDPRLREIAPQGVPVRYIGRRRRQSPAEGDPNIHKKDQERIVTEALTQTVLDKSFVNSK
ncbi:2-oxoglutarate dehydrogenase [Bacillus sp. SA1-12]|uniref:2-oxoglutarate dehydrogenase E1 component n=1 Tax=Bacillus sp. SA1-12 TaxID=1455638 RepID=UPI000626F834|nr:2-oxoglutarate dehydrogenase E1 component [Bacillus sp. SA1-12]KKI90192.1 2-oxoglutarate dehydrogenase [Bacillus sp. SA1-12]